MTPRLNDKQERFIYEYLVDMNAAAAARRAGYSGGTRGNQSTALMKNPLIRERIAIELADMLAELKVTARELMRERARIAFFRPIEMFDANGRLRPLHEIGEERMSVLTIDVDARADGKNLLRIRQPDRQKALAALEKAHALVMENMWKSMLPYEGSIEEEEEDCAGLQAVQVAVETPEPARRAEKPAPVIKPEGVTKAAVWVRGAPAAVERAADTSSTAAVPPVLAASSAPAMPLAKQNWLRGGANRFGREGAARPKARVSPMAAALFGAVPKPMPIPHLRPAPPVRPVEMML